MSNTPLLATPTSLRERYQILDVLRGFALLGVLVANLVELGGEDILATADQLGALPSATADARTSWILDLFVFDKANTLFAVLFGVGSWLMMERLAARGVASERIYLRRITILTIIGFTHLLGWFAWDILHLYGMMAFVLFFSRNLSDRALFWLALPLLMIARPLLNWGLHKIGFLTQFNDAAYTEAAVLARQSAAQSGDLAAWVGAMNWMNWMDWFVGGVIISWFAYGLGRFYFGAWIARQGWIQSAESRTRFVAIWTLPVLGLGLGLQLISMSLQDAPGASWAQSAPLIPELLTGIATPLIATGYVFILVLLLFNTRLAWLARPFSPIGQMALTNYLIQSPFIILLLTGIGPGLGLAGRAGSTDYTLYALAFFAVQAVFSHFWMKVFAYGPAEWLWRSATYGRFPRIRRTA